MHIALNAWFWDALHTGSGQYLRRLLGALLKAESTLRVTLIFPTGSAISADLPANVQAVVAPPHRLGGKLGKLWFEQRAFPRLAAQSGADLAHVPYWGSPLSCRLPLVVSVLDVIPLLYPAYSLGAANRLYTSLVSTSARAADHVLTISHTSQLDIEYWLNIPQGRVSVTYLAPDEQYHPRLGAERDADVRAKYQLPEKYVLYLGGFDARKRVLDIIEAYQYVRKGEEAAVPLVLAGREPAAWGGLFPDVRARIRELELEDFVQFIGYVDEADKPALYRQASVFVWPSEYEGFGLPPLEAMACGTPVVAADTVIHDEILGEAAYLVDNPRSMAGAIIALILQQPFREAMVNQGLAHATQYQWRKTAKQTLAVYERVLHAAGKRA